MNFVHYPILHQNDSVGQHAKANLREHEGVPVDQVTEVRVKNSEGDGGSELGPGPLPERSPRPDPPEEGTDRRKPDPVVAPLDAIDRKVTDPIRRKLNGQGSRKPLLRHNHSWAPGLQTADGLGRTPAHDQPHEVADRREQDPMAPCQHRGHRQKEVSPARGEAPDRAPLPDPPEEVADRREPDPVMAPRTRPSRRCRARGLKIRQ